MTLETLQSTIINDENSKIILSEIIRKEFDLTENEERAFTLLQIAYKYNLSCLETMIDDYSIHDFKWF